MIPHWFWWYTILDNETTRYRPIWYTARDRAQGRFGLRPR